MRSRARKKDLHSSPNWSVPRPDDVDPPWVDKRTSRKPYKLERILMLSQQEMEDFMAVEAALDERDELAAKHRKALST